MDVRIIFLGLKDSERSNLSVFKWKVTALSSLRWVRGDSKSMEIYRYLPCFVKWVVNTCKCPGFFDSYLDQLQRCYCKYFYA
jgi:hypothetical protein